MIPKAQAHLAVSAATHEGMRGKNNEDRYGVSAHTVSEESQTSSLFAIVADGIGGHQAGEIAAEIAVETISEHVANSDASDPLTILNEAIIRAGQAVHQQSNKDMAQQGMGSTCVCAWIIGKRLYTASVGDSRIYLFRGEIIQQISTDHTWVQEAIQYGIITPDQARGHPQSHIIRRYLGSKKPAETDFRLRLTPEETDEQAIANQGMELLPGDRLLLCSDGLTDLVEDHEIQTKLETNPLDNALAQLIDLANLRGGHDNITIVVLQVPDESLPRSKKKSQKPKLFWLTGAILGLLSMIVIIALAFLAWRITRPTLTPTPTPTPTSTLQATTPILTETSPPPTDEVVETPKLSTPTKETPPPPKATYTLWPTSTQNP